MASITRDMEGGFRLSSGRYAVIGQSWNGTLPDPREGAGRHDELVVRDVQEPTLVECDGMDVLILPIGRDSAGAPGRSVAIGSDTIVAFERIAIVAVDAMTPRRYYPYASHIDEVAILVVQDGLVVTADDGGYDFDARDGNDFHEGIDTRTPGAFTIDGDMFDMADAFTAKAFDYGSEAFNAKLDEHGFVVDVDEVVARAKAMGGPEAIAIENRLRGCGGIRIAYYAPVQN